MKLLSTKDKYSLSLSQNEDIMPITIGAVSSARRAQKARKTTVAQDGVITSPDGVVTWGFPREEEPQS